MLEVESVEMTDETTPALVSREPTMLYRRLYKKDTLLPVPQCTLGTRMMQFSGEEE
jgi:hypothetical protein